MAAYPGRTDLQVPKVAPNQPQGVAGEQRAALHAVPMGPNQPPQTGPVGQPQGPALNVVPMGAPTQHPNEPVTAGADVGPGPGSEVLPQPPVNDTSQDPVRMQVAALYKVNPNADVLRLIELLDAQGR